MLKLQKTYAKDGLVCISLTTDPAAKRETALKKLKDLESTIANYWLDEKPDLWLTKFDTGGPPVAVVFDRDGRRAAKFDSSDPDKPFDYTDVEKVVKELLKKQ